MCVCVCVCNDDRLCEMKKKTMKKKSSSKRVD